MLVQFRLHPGFYQAAHTVSEEFKNATITGHFGFVFVGNSVREIM